jgi:hypothetical protein
MDGRDESENPFSLLADETRLGVIELIGDRSGDGEYATLSYSTIRAGLGGVDSGNLNYHLRKLVGRFLEKTDEGYRLAIPGIRVYQAISSGEYEGDRPTVPPTETEYECEECDAPVFASYEDGRFFLRCHECVTRYYRYPLSPNAFDEDDVDSLVEAAMLRTHLDIEQMLVGICPYCSGSVERTLSADDRGVGHDEWTVYVKLACRSCGWYNQPAVEMVPFHHSTMWVFFDRRGVYDYYRYPETPGHRESEILSTDPWRIEVEYHYQGDSIRHVVDGTPQVVEWEIVD